MSTDILYFSFSPFPPELGNVFEKNKKKKNVCVQATFFPLIFGPHAFVMEKKAPILIFIMDQEFENSCIKNSMSKVEV